MLSFQEEFASQLICFDRNPSLLKFLIPMLKIVHIAQDEYLVYINELCTLSLNV